MLQRQSWLAHLRSAHLPRRASCNSRFQRTLSQHHQFNTRKHSSILPENNEHASRRLFDQVNTARRRISNLGHHKKSRNSEPWVNPSSLADSLEAHQTANRIGLARDGIPTNVIRRKAQSLRDGRRNGVKILRFAESNKQQHKTEHGGVCPPLLSEWRVSESVPSQLLLPWLSCIDAQTSKNSLGSARQRLEAEVRACERYFSPSASEKKAALEAFAHIQDIILQSLGTEVRVDLVGSRKAGTDGPISDLDITVQPSTGPQGMIDLEANQSLLLTLDKCLRKSNFRRDIVLHAYLKRAHVPIIIGTHSPSGLEFQIQCTDGVYDSLEVSKAFVAEYPAACVVFKIMKQMLSMRGLTQGVFGGITSYPLLNMVVTSLKVAGSHIASDDVTSQLLLFLDFWSDFNFDRHRIVLSLEHSTKASSATSRSVIDPISTIPQIVPKRTTNESDNYMMSLEDPADPSNDLGSGANSIKHIQAFLIEARHGIWQSMQDWEAQSNDPISSIKQQSLLARCLGGNYTAFEEARWQLNQYSRRDPIAMSD